MKRSKGGHRGAFTRQLTTIYQAAGSLDGDYDTFEVLIDRRKILSELNAQIQQLIED